jgi:hypothetical protein
MKHLALLVCLLPAVAVVQQQQSQQEYNGPPTAQIDASITEADTVLTQLVVLRAARINKGADTRDVDSTIQSIVNAKQQLMEMRTHAVQAGR